MKIGINLAKLLTNFYAQVCNSSNVNTKSSHIPAAGEVPVHKITLLIPVKRQAIYSGNVLAPTIVVPKSF